tara:strand:- start:6325 stop:6489 length:165 start_codon:yes stop_codon:yes gene_type:complete
MANNNDNLPPNLNEEDLSYQEQVERLSAQQELEEIEENKNYYDNEEDFDINVEE